MSRAWGTWSFRSTYICKSMEWNICTLWTFNTPTVNNGTEISNAYLNGFYFEVYQKSSNILYLVLKNLTGTVVYACTSTASYTYVNNVSAFHIFVNSPSCNCVKQLLYHHTGVATHSYFNAIMN